MEKDRVAYKQQVKKALFERMHLQPADLRDIRVSAFDDHVLGPFNLKQCYLMDEEGIILPVHGHLYEKKGIC